jgi:CRP/FNR family transcriptional regulator, nitrogen oxide reductase regulator
MPEDRITALQRCPFLRGLAREDLQLLVESARTKSTRKGDLFFREGDSVAEIYVLVRGRVKLVWSDPQGHEVITRVARPGDAFGYVEALGGSARLVSAAAVEDSDAVAVSADGLVRMMTRRPAAALTGLRLLAQQVLDGWRAFQMLVTEPVERRIAQTLLKFVQPVEDGAAKQNLIELRLSHQEIAELTGTTTYTVSRIVSRWKHSGIVAVGRSKVIIRMPQELAALAGRDSKPSDHLRALRPRE